MRIQLMTVSVVVLLSCGRSDLLDDDGGAWASAGGEGNESSGSRGAPDVCIPRPTCTREPAPARLTLEYLRGTCSEGLLCVPEDERCRASERCVGRCVFLDLVRNENGTPRVPLLHGSCPACGPCSFMCGGIAGFSCPLNCRGSPVQWGNIVDGAGRCLVD